MSIEYLIGIDLGHGETTASVYNLTDENPTVEVLQLLDGKQKTVYSALYHENGEYKIVKSKQDLSKTGVSAYFKGRIDQLSEENRKALKTFFKLVVDSLFASNGYLQYDKKTGDKNFLLYLACPSGWIDANYEAPKYKKFLQEVIPIEWIISESDAAFFNFYDRNNIRQRKVLVIEFGSGAIDFTAYGEGKRVASWGKPHGAHAVERAILDYYIKNSEDYEENCKTFLNYWGNNPPMDIRKSFELHFREAKEKFYMYGLDLFDVVCRGEPYFGGRREFKRNIIECCIPKAEVDTILSDYKTLIKDDFKEVKERLTRNGFIPEVVILSGGASRMPFVKEFAEEVFGVKEGYKTLLKDASPEHVVSHGIAKYAYAMHLSEQDVQEFYSKAIT